MNYLALCQRTARECGVSGTGPTTVLSQVGELSRIVTWVATALEDIETAHPDWQWMKREMSFVTVAGQAEYTTLQCGITAGTFGTWERYRFRNYPTAVGNIGEIEMGWTSYDEWRDSYSYGATRYVQTRPMDAAMTPDQGLALGPYPAAGYTITGQYYRAPQILAADSDLPEMDTNYHMGIVYKAMMHYGMYESATEVVERGQEEFQKVMNRMNAKRMPEVTW